MKSTKLLEALWNQREKDATLESLADEFQQQFGAATGIIKELKLLFDSESIAKSEKTKILLAGMDLIREVSKNKISRDPNSEMSDEDMLAAMKALDEQFSGRSGSPGSVPSEE